MTTYQPPAEPLHVPPASSLTFADRFAIKAATGIGVTEAAMSNDLDSVTAALAWFAASRRPEYQSPPITFDNILQWTPAAVTFADDTDDDAADLAQAAAERAADYPSDDAPFTEARAHEPG